MRLWTLLLAFPLRLLPYAVATSVGLRADLVYQYDTPTWIENLAVRADGQILLATATSAVLAQLDPITGKQYVVLNKTSIGNAIMSITEIVPDMFLINTLDCDMSILSCTPGSGVTWQVDLRGVRVPSEAKVRQLAKGPDPTSLLNGVAALNDRIVLMVDQALGGIWGVDLLHGGAKLLFTDISMTDPTSQGNGVNGIRVRGSTLYFNNPSMGTFCRMAIDPSSGHKTGDATVITSGLQPDDFEIDELRGVAYITNGPANQLLKIDLNTGRCEVIVDGLLGPTTARWVDGKNSGKALYVATTGGYPQWLSGNATVGGAVYRVEV